MKFFDGTEECDSHELLLDEKMFHDMLKMWSRRARIEHKCLVGRYEDQQILWSNKIKIESVVSLEKTKCLDPQMFSLKRSR